MSSWSSSFSLSLQVIQPSPSWPSYLLTHDPENHYTSTPVGDSRPRLFGPLVPAGVSADGIATSCKVELDALRSAIVAAGFTGQKATADEANLLAEADAAQAFKRPDMVGP